jgi:hypothetical protein
MPEPILLRTDEAAAFACVRPVTIHMWARRWPDRLHNVGTARSARWDLAELTAFLRDRDTSAPNRTALDHGR